MDLIFWIFTAFLGSLAGLLDPNQNPAWARLQKIAFALLCGALVAWLAAYVIAHFSLGTGAFWTAVIGGAVSFVGYLIVADECRVYYEKHREDESKKK